MNRNYNLKKWFLLSVISLITAATFAQEQQTSAETALTPKFGIKGGINFSNLYVSDVSSENLKVGFNAGVYAKIPVVTGFSIEPEILYTVKGAQENYDNTAQGNGSYRFNLNYVEVPLLAVINITKNFNIHAGPYFAILTSANVQDVDNNGNITGATALDQNDFKNFDWGLAGGAAFDIEDVTLGARYNYGLEQIGKSGLAGDLTQNSKNSVIAVYVGFTFQ
jgi:hypothetical protein